MDTVANVVTRGRRQGQLIGAWSENLQQGRRERLMLGMDDGTVGMVMQENDSFSMCLGY